MEGSNFSWLRLMEGSRIALHSDFTSGREATLVDIASGRVAELHYILTSPQGRNLCPVAREEGR